ncbi:ABC transporter permease [Tahibacter amnicola]|uniref:ABC transporter permease n=1 Tax=Tahibacter amnicola TaxID=2976241 RepID=A0ABY6BEX4_9GAMM|nr:ABC transporter permease [Tahibacter amnicola]UXI68584.1 ABC transporter permease [Tahibacter amnicola]
MTTLILARHEWRRLLVQSWTWGLLAATVALLAYLFLLQVDAFLGGQSRLAATPDAPGVTDLVAVPLLRMVGNLQLFLVPLLTMRAVAGERRDHSLALLLSSGVDDGAIVLGKWLGVMGWNLALIALATLMPLSLLTATPVDLGRVAAAVLGLMAQAALLSAVGIYLSTLTRQPPLAAALGVAANLGLNLVDAGARLNGLNHGLINWIALPSHLDPLMRGLVSAVDLAYFAIGAAACLALAAGRVGSLRSAD